MNHPPQSVYQQVIEKTKGAFFRTQVLRCVFILADCLINITNVLPVRPSQNKQYPCAATMSCVFSLSCQYCPPYCAGFLNDGNQAEWHQAGVQVVRLFYVSFVLSLFISFFQIRFFFFFFSWPLLLGGCLLNLMLGEYQKLYATFEIKAKNSGFLCSY